MPTFVALKRIVASLTIWCRLTDIVTKLERDRWPPVGPLRFGRWPTKCMIRRAASVGYAKNSFFLLDVGAACLLVLPAGVEMGHLVKTGVMPLNSM